MTDRTMDVSAHESMAADRLPVPPEPGPGGDPPGQVGLRELAARPPLLPNPRRPDRLAAAALLLILSLAAAFRFLGVDWDAGQHLHPDERFLTMVTTALAPPESPYQYFDTQTSQLNPRNVGYELFVYGTLPINLVYFVARAWDRTSYGDVYLVGRQLMAVFDLLAIVVLYLLGRELYGRRVGLLAALLAACTAFLIQQAHFFTVDSAANFFVMLFLLAAVHMMRRGNGMSIAVAGAALGLALASKVSIWPLVPLAVLGLFVSERHRGLLRTRDGVSRWLLEVVLLGLAAFLTLRVAQPDMWAGPGWSALAADPTGTSLASRAAAAPGWWALLRQVTPDALEPLLLPDPRWAENMDRVRGMITGHGMDWPPNHQWWSRTSYVYPWRNLVLYGMGLPLGLWATVAFVAAGLALARGRLRHFLPWTWVAIVFAYQGGAWVKTMRYFLPIYPAAILLAAWLLVAVVDVTRRRASVRQRPPRRLVRWAALAIVGTVLVGTFVWGAMVTSIYAREHSRVAGSRWIYHNVPAATALTVASGALPGPLLPVRLSNTLDVIDYRWRLEEDRRLDSSRVFVPGPDPVVVDGVQLAHLVDPAEDPAPESIRAWLTTRAFAAEDGTLTDVLAEGSIEVDLKSVETAVRVPLPPTTLEPGGEYYLWLAMGGAPIAGRLSILAVETTWDDHIPLGLDQLTAWDDPGTQGAEGFYGQVNLELYDEDEVGKVERMVAALEQADYVVITSNRVYGSVAQLPSRFPMTIEYYRGLFAEELGFEHVADVHSYPSLGPWEVNDQPADEAWHVYDHPKVDVFARTEGFDARAVRELLAPKVAEREWQWPRETVSPLTPVMDRLGALLPGRVAAQGVPADGILLDAGRWARQQAGGTWRSIFDPDSFVNRSPALAAAVWYAVVALLGVLAFPLLWWALPGLTDRGWSVARTAGVLVTGWLAWLVGSTGLVPHTPSLVWGAVCVLGLASLAAASADPRGMIRWLRSNARLIAVEEGLFLVLFALFLAIRIGNPDLWHPYYGGEKPMDLAYLNAVVRSESFPPYDPWFAAGRMNYYYFGFVLIGALIELTRIVPWLAYNLAVPTLAALTGLAVFGIVVSCLPAARSARRWRAAVGVGSLGAVMAVVSGNLFQVPFMLGRIVELGAISRQSAIPGVQRLLELGVGLGRWLERRADLSVPTGHWYWNASRAIADVPGDTQPITEFPFFTFLYADLHAHMMALPLTMLALAVSVSWALAPRPDGARAPTRLGRHALRLALGALAIGALWPTNTWDYPTYGLVAACAIALGRYAVRGRLSIGWLTEVAAVGVPLLALSLAMFWPYHASYAQPYGEFQRWESIRTPASAYLVIHGLFLFPLVTWGLLRLWRDLRRPGERAAAARHIAASGAVLSACAAALWVSALARLPEDKTTPSAWTPIIGVLLLTLGVSLLVRRRATTQERLLATLLVVGAALTQLVEHFVLAGDIGRMNTVFKFYIQVWLLWAVGAAIALGWLLPALPRLAWGRAWRSVMAVLLACGLVYTVTAARAKIGDRFPAMGPMDEAGRAAYYDGQGPGLSGMAYTDYAVYDDNGAYLRLADDALAMRWLMENVDGTPVVLEGFREAGYRWGSRYSIYTGFPTVIGWDWHQKQQRNAAGSAVVEQRIADVREIYDSTDGDRALQLMRAYDVRYVVVGQMERAQYASDGLAKFEKLVEEGRAERAFVGGVSGNETVTIYRLTDAEGHR